MEYLLVWVHVCTGAHVSVCLCVYVCISSPRMLRAHYTCNDSIAFPKVQMKSLIVELFGWSSNALADHHHLVIVYRCVLVHSGGHFE